MTESDSSIGEVSLHPTWMALGHRVAVAGGASTALLSLLRDVPLLAACKRGVIAWLATIVLVRTVAWLLAHTQLPPAIAAGTAGSDDDVAGGPEPAPADNN